MNVQCFKCGQLVRLPNAKRAKSNAKVAFWVTFCLILFNASDSGKGFVGGLMIGGFVALIAYRWTRDGSFFGD